MGIQLNRQTIFFTFVFYKMRRWDAPTGVSWDCADFIEAMEAIFGVFISTFLSSELTHYHRGGIVEEHQLNGDDQHGQPD